MNKTEEIEHWKTLFSVLGAYDNGNGVHPNGPAVTAENVVAELARQHWCAAGSHWHPFCGVSERGICDECWERLYADDPEADNGSFARAAREAAIELRRAFQTGEMLP